ncbi:sigma-70 family RNA polymerase sigma factor [Olivibacter sp. SDN3]|uniref:RNA polymerase sigma factor n=1 Tax=Olivibacter sp. SDN3 TaxID=2764720 RepID=UPI00165154FE|nr:sigma-70 family RNA polymerase sigma factor [Olivibacter sp. SDN3]QNL51577.1 sigma-70 family RNA polymerase sigma factor [Olivibacter sp. SDN3]
MTHTLATELEEILELKRSNAKTFHKVYIRFEKPVLAYFFSKTRSNELAEEMFQATFTKLWQYAPRLATDLPLSKQVFRVARTCMIDLLRQKARERSLKDAFIEEKTLPTHSHNSSLAKLAYDDLLKALDILPPVRKKVFYLSKIEGYTNKEIASKMEISQKTVEDHMTKALKKLRSSMAYPLLLFFIQQ